MGVGGQDLAAFAVILTLQLAQALSLVFPNCDTLEESLVSELEQCPQSVLDLD